jgi:hypothetical protein
MYIKNQIWSKIVPPIKFSSDDEQVNNVWRLTKWRARCWSIRMTSEVLCFQDNMMSTVFEKMNKVLSTENANTQANPEHEYTLKILTLLSVKWIEWRYHENSCYLPVFSSLIRFYLQAHLFTNYCRWRLI